MAIDDQLQFKIDDKMRQLHRKEMQAQVAANYDEAARTRQVLNTALFSRSLTARPTGAGAPAAASPKAPRLQDVRQSTFTQLGSPAAFLKAHQKSRSLVDVRCASSYAFILTEPRSLGLEVRAEKCTPRGAATLCGRLPPG